MIHHAAAIVKTRRCHNEYGRLSNIAQAPQRQPAGTTVQHVDATAPARQHNNSKYNIQDVNKYIANNLK